MGGLWQTTGVSIAENAGILGKLIHFFTIFTGYAGLILSGIGAAGLLQWRISDKEQRRFNSPAEYINLILFVIVVAVTLISQFTYDVNFVILRGYVQSLVTFSAATIPNSLFYFEIVLIAFLIMYIPLTRMSHFVAKYFLYHAVRWNDEPNERGSKIEKSLIELLNQKVGWSAPHIKTGKSWIEVVKETKNEQ